MRQNSSKNAEQWANILGTKDAMQFTYKLQKDGTATPETGLGTARSVKEYLYHPDEIKTLQTGKGIYMSKDGNFHSNVTIHKPF